MTETLPSTIPPAPAVMAILSRFNRDDLGAAIEVLVSLLDIWDGEPDREDNGDREPTGDDQGDQAWIEWHTMRGAQKRGHNLLAGEEDVENDDPAGQYDEDSYTGPKPHDLEQGAGCPIADPGGCQHDGREPCDGL